MSTSLLFSFVFLSLSPNIRGGDNVIQGSLPGQTPGKQDFEHLKEFRWNGAATH